MAATVVCGAIAVVAGPIGVAQASDASIAATFRAANPRLNADEARVTKADKAFTKHHKPGPVIAALRREVRDIHALNRSIEGQAPSSAKGQRGKHDVVTGLRLIASAYAALATDIHKAHIGHPVAQSTLQATVARQQRGRRKLLAGLKLLGLKVRG